MNEEIEVINLDINSICRTCLQMGDGLKSIFDYDKENHELSSMINELSAIKVAKEDGFPNLICLNCVQHLKFSVKFKRQCEKSNNLLNQFRNTKLVENDVEIDTVKIKKDEFTQTEELSFLMCEMCDLKFMCEDSLRSHRAEHKQFKCKKCAKVYTRLHHLQRHTSAQHPEITNPKVLKAHDFGTCCNKQFFRLDHLQRHMKTHHPQKEIETVEIVSNLPVEENKDLDYDLNSDNNIEDNSNTNVKIVLEPELPIINEDDLKTEFNEEPELGFENETSDLDDNNDNIEEEEVMEENIKQEAEEEENDDEEDETIDTSTTSINDNMDVDIKTSNSKLKKEKNELFCDICNVNFTMKSKYSKHMEKEHQIVKINKCEKCDKTFSRATHLRRHELTHLEIKPFKCDLCEKRFSRVDHLNLHMFHHSDVKPFQCDVCEKGFTRAEHLKRHKDTRHSDKPNAVKTEYCEICKKSFTTPKYLNLHKKIHTQRNWPCKMCQEVFSSKSDLNSHQKTHVNERPFLCSECGLRFVRNDYLVIHMRRHKGEKPYKCKFCDKGFPRATDLTVHERYHTGEKTHLCTICGKGFQRAYNLLVHTRVHTGERPYKCPHCDKRFAQGNDLKAHVRRHTGERYKCELCPESFIQLYHLTQHKRTAHGIDMKSRIRRVEKFITPHAQQQRVLEQQQLLLKQTVQQQQQPSETENNSEVVENAVNTEIEPVVKIDMTNTVVKKELDLIVEPEIGEEVQQHILQGSIVEMHPQTTILIPAQLVSEEIPSDSSTTGNLPMMPILYNSLHKIKVSPMHSQEKFQ